MKEKRTVYIVKEDCIFKVFDTLAEAKAYMIHEYLKWFSTEDFEDFGSDDEKLHWFFEDIRNIDEHGFVGEMFYLHEAEYGGD